VGAGLGGCYPETKPTGTAKEARLTRADFQRLANERVADAKALLAAGRWSAAYYLAGYAVECGLKACILARVATAAEVIFADRRYSEKCWTHDLPQLVDLAGLKAALAADCAAELDLQENWDIVRDWSEASRYARTAKRKAESLYRAITDKKHGVLSWIKGRW
jgi:HEPN domain-containing protein